MSYLKYLYYKYYVFQTRVGNSDIAPLSAMLIILFTIMLYYFSLFFLLITFVSKDELGINMYFFTSLSISIFLFLFIWLYFLFIFNSKYKEIIKSYETEINKKYSFGAIIFPLFAFILFNFSWILKMLQNQGNI